MNGLSTVENSTTEVAKLASRSNSTASTVVATHLSSGSEEQAKLKDAAVKGITYVALRLDQDTGGAIRAPGRSDLYMGEGEANERRAGGQYAEGQLYYLIVK